MTTQTAAAPGAVAPGQVRAGLIPRVVAWSVVPLYLAGVALYEVLDRRLGQPGLDPVEGLSLWVGFGMFAAMGALLAVKRPRNAVGWVMAGAALLLVTGATGELYAAWVMTTRGRPDALAVLGAWVQSWYWLLMLWLVFAVLPLVFPDGRLPSRRWRRARRDRGPGALGLVVGGMLTDTLTGQDVDYRIDNPIGVDGLPGVEEQALFPVFSGLLPSASSPGSRRSSSGSAGPAGPSGSRCQVVPVRRRAPGAPARARPAAGDGRQRGASGWCWRCRSPSRSPSSGTGSTASTSSSTGRWSTARSPPSWWRSTSSSSAISVPALRREDDLLISLLATGIVAVLFAPLRDRLQRAVSRLLYGQRAEPYAAISRLGERLESTLAPDAVLPAIVTTVRESLRLPYAAIELAGGEPAVESGEPVARTVRFPLLYRSEPVGELVLGRRQGEDDFSPADRRLVATWPARQGSRCPPSGSPPTCSVPGNGWSPPARRSGGGCGGTCTTVSARSWPGSPSRPACCGD